MVMVTAMLTAMMTMMMMMMGRCGDDDDGDHERS